MIIEILIGIMIGYIIGKTRIEPNNGEVAGLGWIYISIINLGRYCKNKLKEVKDERRY